MSNFSELTQAKHAAAYWYQEYRELREAAFHSLHPCLDEKHCSCVPHLHTAIHILRRELIAAVVQLVALDECTVDAAAERCMLTREEMEAELEKENADE